LKFIYCDESGSQGESPVFVMSGLLIDAYRLRLQNHIINGMIEALLGLYPGAKPNELKTKKMLSGGDKWSRVDADVRKDFVSKLCDQVVSTSKVISIVMDFEKFNTNKSGFGFCHKHYWIASAIYIACVAERTAEQGGNIQKNSTIIIMDDHKMDMAKLSDLLYSPPDILTELTGQRPNKLMRNIVDTALAIKSDHSGLVQAADCVAYITRRWQELQLGDKPAYTGEPEFIGAQYSKLASRRITLSSRLTTDLATLFRSVASDGWKI